MKIDREEWKDVNGYNGKYLISNLGRVRSYSLHGHGRIIKNQTSVKGYKTHGLHKNGKTKTWFTHRLIAIHFIPNPDNKPFINHIDGIKHNNSIENLEWCTQKENCIHAVRIGLFKISDKHREINSRLMSAKFGSDAHASKKIIHTGTGEIYDTVTQAAKAFGLKLSTLSAKLIGQSKNNTPLKYYKNAD